MYRRHLRMVLVRDVEMNTSRSEFVQRITSIPVVYLAWNIAAETYRSVKCSNSVFHFSLTTTEKAAKFVSRPVIKTFRKQLEAADILACRGLETLQGIVSQPEKLYKQTREYYDETVESGLKKYAVIKRMGSSKASELMDRGSQKLDDFLSSPYGEVYELILDSLFDAGELYVDYYLPPLGDERPESLFGDRGKRPSGDRALYLKNRFKERLYKHSLLQIQRFRIRTRLLVAKVYKMSMQDYLVEVSSSVPQVLLVPVITLFSSFQEMILYLRHIFGTSVKSDTSPV